MATGKLLGTDTQGTQSDCPIGVVHCSQFVCAKTGLLSELKVDCKVSSNVRVAIYSDNGSNQVGDLLAESNSTAITSGAWRTVSLLSSAFVVSGTKYWLGVQMQTAGGCGYRIVTALRGYMTWTYGAFPGTGSGFNYASDVEYSLQGWGSLVLIPSGISQPTALGSPKLDFILYPSGISQALAYGTPLVELAGSFIYPTGIEQVVALGTPEVIKLLQFIYPTGIAQPLVIGTPVLIYPQTLAPQGIEQAIDLGTPSVAIYGIIRPDGIAQVVAIGSPSLYKYVWHVILDGQYATETPEKNRLFVIGRDEFSNPVWGEAQESTEIGLVGERLDFQQELAVPTTAQVSSMASAILSKMRLTGKRGVILIPPPNCGQELFDVVELTDKGANQSAVSFRVVGIRFEYNPKQARFKHRLILGAP